MNAIVDTAFAFQLQLTQSQKYQMLPLTDIETRVLGSLIEKDITTPDYYPLSLNALVNACNQKNNRDPVMSLDEDSVAQALATLQEKRLAGPASGADSRVTKYEHRLQEVFNFDRREIAILCVLLLRGPQTPRRTPQPHRTHVPLRSPRRYRLHTRPPEPAPASTSRGSPAPTRHQRIPLHASLLRRPSGCGCGAGALARVRPCPHLRRRPLIASRKRSPRIKKGTIRNPRATLHLPQTIRIKTALSAPSAPVLSVLCDKPFGVISSQAPSNGRSSCTAAIS